MMPNEKKQVLGITGGVGAGKSTVLSYLAQTHGAHILECDAIARSAQAPGGICYGPMRRLFGPEYVRSDGSFDRAAIARVIYADPGKKEALTAIVHPAVRSQVETCVRQLLPQGRLIVIEAALLLENGYDDICQEIWYVHTPEAVRRGRLKESRGYTDAQIDGILSAQRSEASFRALCDLTIDNGDPDFTKTARQLDEGLIKHGFLYDSQRQLR